MDTEEEYKHIELTEDQRIIIEAVDELPKREIRVIKRYYLQDISIARLSTKLSISISRVHQLTKCALRLLKDNDKLYYLYMNIKYITSLKNKASND